MFNKISGKSPPSSSSSSLNASQQLQPPPRRSSSSSSPPDNNNNNNPEYAARRSNRVSKKKFQPDNDTWVEHLAVVELFTPAANTTSSSSSNNEYSKKGNNKKSTSNNNNNTSTSTTPTAGGGGGGTNATSNLANLQIRSFFQSQTTGERVWDEPPSGASNIQYATTEARNMAQIQMNELQFVHVPDMDDAYQLNDAASGDDTAPASAAIDNYALRHGGNFNSPTTTTTTTNNNNNHIEQQQSPQQGSTSYGSNSTASASTTNKKGGFLSRINLRKKPASSSSSSSSNTDNNTNTDNNSSSMKRKLAYKKDSPLFSTGTARDAASAVYDRDLQLAIAMSVSTASSAAGGVGGGGGGLNRNPLQEDDDDDDEDLAMAKALSLSEKEALSGGGGRDGGGNSGSGHGGGDIVADAITMMTGGQGYSHDFTRNNYNTDYYKGGTTFTNSTYENEEDRMLREVMERSRLEEEEKKRKHGGSIGGGIKAISPALAAAPAAAAAAARKPSVDEMDMDEFLREAGVVATVDADLSNSKNWKEKKVVDELWGKKIEIQVNDDDDNKARDDCKIPAVPKSDGAVMKKTMGMTTVAAATTTTSPPRDRSKKSGVGSSSFNNRYVPSTGMMHGKKNSVPTKPQALKSSALPPPSPTSPTSCYPSMLSSANKSTIFPSTAPPPPPAVAFDPFSPIQQQQKQPQGMQSKQIQEALSSSADQTTELLLKFDDHDDPSTTAATTTSSTTTKPMSNARRHRQQQQQQQQQRRRRHQPKLTKGRHTTADTFTGAFPFSSDTVGAASYPDDPFAEDMSAPTMISNNEDTEGRKSRDAGVVAVCCGVVGGGGGGGGRTGSPGRMLRKTLGGSFRKLGTKKREGEHGAGGGSDLRENAGLV